MSRVDTESVLEADCEREIRNVDGKVRKFMEANEWCVEFQETCTY